MQLAPSPLESFQLGQQIGQADSPITGIGMAIKNIVEDARKKGLIQMEQGMKTAGAIQQAQAMQPFEIAKAKGIAEATAPSKINVAEKTAAAQGLEARETAKEKRTSERAYQAGEVPFITIGEGGAVQKQKPITRETEIRTEPVRKPGLLEEFQDLSNLKNMIKGGEDTSQPKISPGEETVTIRFNDGTTADMTEAEARAAGYIQ